MKKKAKKKAKAKRSYKKPTAKRSYVANPRRSKARKPRRRSYKKNPAPILDFFLQFLAGLTGAVGIPKIADLTTNLFAKDGVLPTWATPVKNATLGIVGLTTFIFARKMPIVAAAGFGAAMIGGRNLFVNAVPKFAGEDELTQDEVIALTEALNGEDLEYNPDNAFNAPLNGALMGAPLMGAPLMGAPLNGAALM
jgi:hypothetical protein